MQKPTDRWEKKIAPIAVTALVLLYVVPLMVRLVLTVGTCMVYGGGADVVLSFCQSGRCGRDGQGRIGDHKGQRGYKQHAGRQCGQG